MSSKNNSNNNKPQIKPVVPQSQKKPLPEGISKTPPTIIRNENNKSTNQGDNTKKSQEQTIAHLLSQIETKK